MVGKAEGRWVQFYDSTVRCAHAGVNAGGNDVSIAIEIEGRNEEAMTPWQVDCCRHIVAWLEATHGIRKEYRFSTAHNLKADSGYIPHSAVAGSDHSDFWTVQDWNRIVDVPQPTPRGDPDMILVRRNNGTVYLVGLTGPAHITSQEDWDEIVRALADPGNVTANISENTWDNLAPYAANTAPS